MSWTLNGNPTDETPQVSDPTYSLYVVTGGMDRYEGASSESSIAVGNLNEETFSSLESLLSNVQAGSELRRRFSIGTTIGRKYFLAAERQGAFNVMLPAEYTNYGFRIEGYLDLDSVLSADQVRAIFRSITSVSSMYQEGGEPLQQLYMDVMTFFSTGEAPPHVMAELERVANTNLSAITRLQLHGLVGLSVAAGGQLSSGAKVRLPGRVGGQITMDHDLLQSVEGQITVDDIQELLTGATDSAADAFDVDGDQS